MNTRLSPVEQAILTALPIDGTKLTNAQLSDITGYPEPTVRRATFALEGKMRIDHSLPASGRANLWSLPAARPTTSASV